MISDAYVTVTCDAPGCLAQEIVALTSLAGGGWDERHVREHLRWQGWQADREKQLCLEHNEEANA